MSVKLELFPKHFKREANLPGYRSDGQSEPAQMSTFF